MCVLVCVCVCVLVCVCVFSCVCVLVCVCFSVCVLVCSSVCIISLVQNIPVVTLSNLGEMMWNILRSYPVPYYVHNDLGIPYSRKLSPKRHSLPQSHAEGHYSRQCPFSSFTYFRNKKSNTL